MAGTSLLGSRVRDRRLALGLKQADVAARAGISPSYLNLIEHNRRGIAGRVRIGIAEALAMEPTALSEDADRDLLRDLGEAAAAMPDALAEAERSHELVGRFPGWAKLVASQHRRREQLENLVENLTDRLMHDPHLSESLHAILSSVTAIQATSDILVKAESMERLQQRRFQSNVHEESQRLSDLARGLATYLDRLSEAERPLATALDQFEHFLAAHGFHFPALEAGGDSDTLIRASDSLNSAEARAMAADFGKEYLRLAKSLPLAEFLSRGTEYDWSPSRLARAFDTDLHSIFHRLAFLPRSAARPEFGLIVCDGSGTALLRRPLPGFAWPRYGAACPLWPLYQALNRPHAPLSTYLRIPEGQVFLAQAEAKYVLPPDPAGVGVLRSAMVLRIAPATAGMAAVAVGQACRICPREFCDARHEAAIYA